MEEQPRVSFRDTRLASRKAEEAAHRRSQAAAWLESIAGPLGLPRQPSEKEFITCLRSGITLCNAINKIKPGAVPKVVMNQSAGLAMEIQPLPAYQYFENIRNFLDAVEELKLPSFEASDLERDTLEAGSAGKIVDCILALKAYYEWKQSTGGCGAWKYAKSPMIPQTNRMQLNAVNLGASVRRLDLSTNSEKQLNVQNDDIKNEDKMGSLVRTLSDFVYDSKENIDQNLLESWRQGKADSTKLFSKIITGCMQEQELRSVLKDLQIEGKMEMYNSDRIQDQKLLKESRNTRNILKAQENELTELKTLLSSTRVDFSTLQSQLQNDLVQLGSQIQGLSAAAVGYHQAVKENRHLYNLLQELRGNIRVFCRIRPSFHVEAKSSIDYIGNDGSMMILDPLKPQSSRKSFQFNKIFGPNASQEEVYKDTQPLVRSVMDGYNVCIFAYGQTGSGKTHTMCGPSSGPAKDMGINYMALNDLFELSCSRSDINKYEIQVQMVEIYNEQVRDLLCEDTSSTKLEIRNYSGNGGVSLPDAAMHRVQTTNDVLDLMKLGEQNRAFSSTAMNNRSSRSHSVLTVHVHGKDASGSMLKSCLHLVDLAGSERVDKSEVTGDRLKEAQHINKSLACLGDVIAALAQKNSHIPYRNSKLTQLLQNSLGGHAKMLMFAHVSPEADFYGETISTLKFAQRVSTVELGAAHVNKENSEIRKLKEEIDNLKKAIACKEGERSKHTTEITPPRSRKLSIENSVVRKSAIAATLDDKKSLKSPLPRPKLGAENGPIRSRRLSLEGSLHGKNQPESTISASNLQLHTPDTAGLRKENIFYPELLSREDGADAKVSSSSETNSKVFPAEDLCYVSPLSCYSSSQSQLLQNAESTYNTMLLQQPTPDFSRKVEEVVVTPETNNKYRTRSFNPNASSSKGSHIRKSLQTIGKFINGSERRPNPLPLEVTPSTKFGRNNATIVIKSPITADARSRRRQSLTNMSVSRRSSLGGTDTYSTDIQNARTKSPPPVHSSAAKATKRWM
ncbi:kinesin-like protein KIN-14A isoform X1 [Asparagus officinalis]|uniref:kinesin-like protein KIN-14A isoform X1 n=1 Tax=Asparagus officinalis TaxID=4686 RepID=UPI00098E4DBF|nr:kinesin-like protein KIN-14A isoform X1 [Asparagus officinalis]